MVQKEIPHGICCCTVGFFIYSFFFNVKKKVTPRPGLLLAEIWPLWNWTLFFTIESPNPVPPILRLRPLSTL